MSLLLYCSYCACAICYNAIVLMDRVDFTRAFGDLRIMIIFLAHDNAGSKFDKHLISIDFTGYKKHKQTYCLELFLLVVGLFVSNT